MKLVRFH